MDTRLLSIFVAAAETENFRSAAERLGIAPPAVSQRIRQLEDMLGFPVFHRIQRGVELTPAGAQMLNEGRDVLARTAHAIETAKAIRRGVVGKLTLGYGTSVMAEEKLPGLIARYQRHYPDITIELFSGHTMVEMVEAAEAQEVDVIFVRTPILPLSSHLKVTPFSISEMVAVVAKGHPLATRSRISIEDMAEESLIAMEDLQGLGMSYRIHALYEEAGLTPKINLKTSNITALIRLVAAGAGLSILPRDIPAPFSNVRGIPLDAADTSSAAVMVHRRGKIALHVQNFLKMAGAAG